MPPVTEAGSLRNGIELLAGRACRQVSDDTVGVASKSWDDMDVDMEDILTSGQPISKGEADSLAPHARSSDCRCRSLRD
jgi:hypothetical protein